MEVEVSSMHICRGATQTVGDAEADRAYSAVSKYNVSTSKDFSLTFPDLHTEVTVCHAQRFM